VLLHGMPLTNAEVRVEDGTTLMADKDVPVYHSGADGIANVPIERRGSYVLASNTAPKAAIHSSRQRPVQCNACLLAALMDIQILGVRTATTALSPSKDTGKGAAAR